MFSSSPYPNPFAQFERLIFENRVQSIDSDANKVAEKVSKLLVKCIRDVAQLKLLECALISKSESSECVLAHTPDEEINDADLLHLKSVKLLRWPEVTNSSELTPTPTCLNTYQANKSRYCINPYHYVKPDAYNLSTANFMSYSPLNGSSQADDDEMNNPTNADFSEYGPGSSGVVSPLSCMSEDLENDLSPLASPQLLSAQIPDGRPAIAYEEPLFWSSIAYYEMSDRVGEFYQASESRITIDGGTDPSSSERFCLGRLTNIHRTQTIEQSRKNIGQGLKLYYIGGQVYVECLSPNAIFVQSPNCNMHFRWHPATVVKVPANCNLMVFNNRDFAAALAKAVEKGYDDVYHLTRMCQIRVSFVKGWGERYQRQAITHCPCWIEIFLNGPLQWLDRVLSQMGAPAGQCSSRS